MFVTELPEIKILFLSSYDIAKTTPKDKYHVMKCQTCVSFFGHVTRSRDMAAMLH